MNNAKPVAAGPATHVEDMYYHKPQLEYAPDTRTTGDNQESTIFKKAAAPAGIKAPSVDGAQHSSALRARKRKLVQMKKRGKHSRPASTRLGSDDKKCKTLEYMRISVACGRHSLPPAGDALT